MSQFPGYFPFKLGEKVLEGAMAVFICSRCGAVVESSGTPNISGCPSGSHVWHRVCDRGSIVPQPGTHPFQCKKCGKVVYCSGTPYSSGCPSGGSHVWVRLG